MATGLCEEDEFGDNILLKCNGIDQVHYIHCNFQHSGNVINDLTYDLPFLNRFKDGEELQEGRKYHMTYSDYYASLFISDLDLEDAGKFRCKASNEFGEDTTTGKLTVEEILHRRRRKEDLEAVRTK